MIESFGRRLRLVMGLSTDEPEVEPEPVTPLLPEVVFIAYGEDCMLTGRIRMDTARLTDLLNQHDEFELVDVEVASLSEERVFEVKDVIVNRDELLLVHALGPRGEPGRRTRTRQHPLAMQIGPYHVRGYLHALPGSDPISALGRRQPMVPLTDAWIEYEQGDVHQRRRVTTLIVNRHLLDWAVEAEDDEVEMPDLPLGLEHGPLVKDFTGLVRSAPVSDRLE